MECQIYLGLTGPEHVVKEFASTVNVSGAVVREVGGQIKDSVMPRMWKWRTGRKAIPPNQLEDSVAPLLTENENILGELHRHRHDSEVSVTIICRFEDTESHYGYSFSRETIEMLARFGASLQIDAVSIMSPAAREKGMLPFIRMPDDEKG